LGIDEVGGGEPSAAELDDAVIDLVELAGGVGVGVDDDLAAGFFGLAEVEIAEVGAGWGGVVLNGDAEARGGGEEGGDINLVGLALEDLAAGGWPRIGRRGSRSVEDAGGDLGVGLVEAGVDAGDDDIELRQGGVFEVERAVEEDVDLAAGEDAEGNVGFGLMGSLPFWRAL